MYIQSTLTLLHRLSHILSFSLLSRYLNATGLITPPPLPSTVLCFRPFLSHPVIKHGHQLTKPPSSHLQNTNKACLLHVSSNYTPPP